MFWFGFSTGCIFMMAVAIVIWPDDEDEDEICG